MADSRADSRVRSRPGSSGKKPEFKLSEEEKQVLLSCRRNALTRGVAFGGIAMVVLRTLKTRGILPQHMARHSWFYFGGGFLVSFLMGANSYRTKCFERILALENSVLGEQARLYKQKGKDYWKEWKDCQDGEFPGSQQSPSHSVKSSSSPSDHSPAPLSSYNEPPSTGPTDFDPLPNRDQPNMFQNAPTSGSNDPYPSKLRRGRTFDEIREDNRRQQMQQNFPKRDQWMETQQKRQEETERVSEQKSEGAGRIPRRNKYGDIIYDDNR